MTDLLSLGTSGLRAYSRALATVSDNIANAQTPGYAKRSIQLSEALPAGDVILSRNSINPGGVTVQGVTRSIDQWLIDDARISAGDAGRSATRLQWMTAAESALDSKSNGIEAALTSVFTSADRLSTNPGDATMRGQFLQAVNEVAAGFSQTATRLSSMSDGIDKNADVSVDQLNTDMAALERVNGGLRRARAGSSNEATLLDERDRLVDRIGQQIGVSASFGDHGVATLRAAGSGESLVENGAVATISKTMAPDGRLSFSLSTGGGPFTPMTGTFAGLSDAASHVADLRANLDTLAGQIAGDLNAAHQAGIDANGNPGQPLFTGTGSAATLSAAPLTADNVAAAGPGGSNQNILSLASLRTASGPEAQWSKYVAGQALSTSSARAQDSAASTRASGAQAARDSVSEVDLDHEAADLLRFQQSYEAAARVIQVARETIQSILDIR